MNFFYFLEYGPKNLGNGRLPGNLPFPRVLGPYFKKKIKTFHFLCGVRNGLIFPMYFLHIKKVKENKEGRVKKKRKKAKIIFMC